MRSQDTCGSKLEKSHDLAKDQMLLHFCVSTRQVRSSQVKSSLHANFPALSGRRRKRNQIFCDTDLIQVTLRVAKFDERFAMLTPKVAIHSSASPLSQAFVPAVCLKFRFPRGGQFDMFQWGTVVKYVEPNLLAVVWEYVLRTSESSDNKYGTKV